MKRIVSFALAIVLVALVSLKCEAQTFGAPEVMKGKIVAGGNANLGLSGNCFYVGVSPQAGYRLTRSLEVGVRLGYDLNYYFDYYYGRFFYHFFSGAVYGNYEIFRGLYVHVEDEEMCCLVRGKDVNPTAPRWYNSVFVGAGYRQYFSETGFVYYSVLCNLSWDYNYVSFESPYVNPFVIRVGYCKGF